MLRRNRANTFWEIRFSAISRPKFLRATSSNSTSGASRANLTCWTHFCSSHTSSASAKRAWIDLLPCCAKFFSGPTFARSSCWEVNGTPEAAHLLRADPVFLVPLRAVTPTGADSSIWVRCPHGHVAFCDGPTFTYSVSRQVDRATRYWNSGSTAKGVRVSASSANIVIRSVRRLPRNRDPSDR